MITILSRLFIPNCENTDLPEVRRRYGVLSGTVGIFLNLMLFAGKLTAGLLVHSVSITADAFNNLSDAASSVITLIGFRFAGKRRDRNHPFGHGRAEYLTGLLVSVSIVLMGIELAKTSLARILTPESARFSSVAAAILAVSILIKFYMYFYNRRLSDKIASVALRSTAMDSLSDCISTGAVLICQILSLWLNLHLDGWCGLAVSLFILRTGVVTMIETAGPLLGNAPDPELSARMTDLVLRTEGILDMHDLLIHDYGPGHLMVSLHAEVPADLTLLQAHEIIDRLETALNKEFGVECVIHIDPIDVSDQEAVAMKKCILTKLRSLHPDAGLHDFRILRSEEIPVVSFDALIPYSIKADDEDVLRLLTEFLSDNYPGYDRRIRIDRI